MLKVKQDKEFKGKFTQTLENIPNSTLELNSNEGNERGSMLVIFVFK